MKQNGPTRFEMEVVVIDLLPYEPPRVVTYRGDELLQMLGPAQACSFGHSVVMCAQNFGPPNFGPPVGVGQG